MNIAFVASQGGHLGQIKLVFTNKVIGQNNAILITEKPGKSNALENKSFNGKYRTYFFEKDVLLKMNPLNYFTTMISLMRIFKNEKIDLMVTSGAQISIPAVIGAKMLGIKTVFFDDATRIKTTTWSGRACYFFSDIFLVQHPEIAKKYGKKAQFKGSII